MQQTIAIRLLVAAAILLAVYTAGILQGADAPPAPDSCNTLACLQERSQRYQAEMNTIETQFQLLPQLYKDKQAQKKATDDQIEKMLPKGSEKK